MRSNSFARAWRSSAGGPAQRASLCGWLVSVALARRVSGAATQRAPHAALAVALLSFFALASGAARADQQKDPELRAIVQNAIEQAECFEDKYESEVWYKMMEPRIRKHVKDRDERILILKEVICESQREGEVRLPPGLVMAVIHVESRFDRYAVSSAGAVGLMQVMPFWPEELGMKRHELIRIPQNIRMGCAILRFYLKKERNNVQKALARYNGSVGRRTYSDLIMNQWSRYNGADDVGLSADTRQPVLKPASGR
jgi:soluble lytic murein transglycosylase-like protein